MGGGGNRLGIYNLHINPTHFYASIYMLDIDIIAIREAAVSSSHKGVKLNKRTLILGQKKY